MYFNLSTFVRTNKTHYSLYLVFLPRDIPLFAKDWLRYVFFFFQGLSMGGQGALQEKLQSN